MTHANNGRFLPGASGNPGGKPLSAKRVRELLELDLDLYVDALKKNALAGDPVALKIIFDRLCPAPKAGRDPVQIPELYHAENFTDAAKAALDAIARGTVSTEDGAAVLSGLSGVLRTNEMDEFSRRIAALEGIKTGDEGADLL